MGFNVPSEGSAVSDELAPDYDVVVAGGGAARLSGALILAVAAWRGAPR